MLLLVAACLTVSGPATAAGPAPVKRAGATLLVAGRPWRFTGVDLYWLGLDDNLTDAGGPTWPTRARIDSGLAGARAAGATVVRAHTLGISVGCARCLEPTLGVFDDDAFGAIDDAVASARQHGVRLMVPLTDEWNYYHGGKRTFTRWRGYPDDPAQDAATSADQRLAEAHFYTDPVVVADFHAYVAHLLGHVDPQTGLRLGSDPTIAVWETGNELWDAPPDWTEQTAAFIKSLAPRALVADGSAATGKHVADAALDAPSVDIVGGHFYPVDAAWAQTDADVAAAHGKAYVVGEYPVNGPATAAFQHALALDPRVAGTIAWTLLPYQEDGTPEPHGDGYAFHSPGATPAEVAQVAGLVLHAQQVRRLPR